MTDATEWLVEIDDHEAAATTYEHIASREDAIESLRQLVGQGKTATLYPRIPFTVQVDVTVKARRTRKQKASLAPAEPSGGPPPSGSEPPSAGETKASGKEGDDDATGRVTPANEGAGRRPAPSPVSAWDCEVDRYGEDGPCAGPIIYDEVTHGRFCETHMVAVPSGRAEWHRRNGHRNRPVARVA